MMKELSIIAPIKTPQDIADFSAQTKCKTFYVYHKRFMENNFKYLEEFISIAKQNNCNIYVNFKHSIAETDIPEIKKFINYLKTTQIDGVLINSFAVLELLKTENLPFKVIIDSYFEIHNLTGIDFVNSFHKIDKLIITEEIYMKNIAKIKKYTKMKLAVDSDNIPWCAEDIIKSKAIDTVVIKGRFQESKDILEGILLIQKILEKPKMFKNQKLPFKHVRKSFYQTNHFSGEILSAEGSDFKFSRNIKKFEWKCKYSKLHDDFNYAGLKLPKLCLRLTSLNQLNSLKRYIEKLGFNPVKAIEFGEIASTSDLSKQSFNDIINKVKKFCATHNIEFQISTPRILIERDFDRVYEYVKNLCLQVPHPTTIRINNIGYLWAVINDEELSRFHFEIGDGINLLNSTSIKYLSSLCPIESVDFTNFPKLENLQSTLKKIKNIIPNKKLTIAGNLRVPTLGLCPLNSDSAIVSRLSCKAPCHKGNFAINDPSLKKVLPFVVDGFCRMHMFDNELVHMYKDIEDFKKQGITEFVIDLSDLPAKFVPMLLTNTLNAIAGFEETTEYKTCWPD